MAKNTYTSLQQLTGYESGAVYFKESGEILICNWSSVDGIPRLDPFGYAVMGLGEKLQARRCAVPAVVKRAMQEHEREQGGPVSETGFQAWEINDEYIVVVQKDWN